MAIADPTASVEFAELRADYRAFSFQTLITAAVSFAGGLIEREATVKTVLERSAAAMERLRFAEWLEAL